MFRSLSQRVLSEHLEIARAWQFNFEMQLRHPNADKMSLRLGYAKAKNVCQGLEWIMEQDHLVEMSIVILPLRIKRSVVEEALAMVNAHYTDSVLDGLDATWALDTAEYLGGTMVRYDDQRVAALYESTMLAAVFRHVDSIKCKLVTRRRMGHLATANKKMSEYSRS